MPQTRPYRPDCLWRQTNAGADSSRRPSPRCRAAPMSSSGSIRIATGSLPALRCRRPAGRQRIPGQRSPAGPRSSSPASARSTAAAFVVAWQYGSFNNADIHAQRYDSAGTPVGGEFTVNSALPTSSSMPGSSAGRGRLPRHLGQYRRRSVTRTSADGSTIRAGDPIGPGLHASTPPRRFQGISRSRRCPGRASSRPGSR